MNENCEFYSGTFEHSFKNDGEKSYQTQLTETQYTIQQMEEME